MNRVSLHDPHGYVCYENQKFYRIVLKNYQINYDKLVASNLYKTLIDKGLLISHTEIESETVGLQNNPEVYKVLLPEQLDFISYPQEWSFSMLQDAALLTLAVQQEAIKQGFVLKDAAAYNIQFHKGKPIFIDSLSFQVYENGTAWQAYRQFCQHFLAPLFLMAYTDVRLNLLFSATDDGIPLKLAAKLLPFKAKFNFGALWHIFFHAQMENDSANAGVKKQKGQKNKNFTLGFIEELTKNLQTVTQKIRYQTQAHWSKYYQINVEDNYLACKTETVKHFLEQAKPKYLWDLGTNTGNFSILAMEKGIKTVSFDYDHDSIELFYCQLKQNSQLAPFCSLALPLIINLANPTSASGWANSERKSWTTRNLPDTLLALALIHHVRITDNIPLEEMIKFFASIAPNLIIEFVPKEDEKVQILLQNKTDFYTDYTQQNFETILASHYELKASKILLPSARVLYWCARKF